MSVNKENAILLCDVDREDLWVCNGFVFRLDKKYTTYKEALDYIWEQITTSEFYWEILKGDQYVTPDIEDYFQGYTCYNVEANSGYLSFYYKHKDGNELTINMSCHFVWLQN